MDILRVTTAIIQCSYIFQCLSYYHYGIIIFLLYTVSTAAIQTSASNVPLWVGASVGVLVVIVLLLVLGTTAAVVLAKYKTKTTRCNEIGKQQLKISM